jgi:hypothetical protein
MPSSDALAAELARTVGLCARCVHAARHETARRSVFWRCRRAESDADYLRYPRLPVANCPGFEPTESATR